MTKIFDTYQEAIALFTSKVREISESINTNRLQHKQAVASLEEAMIHNKPTDDLEKDIARLDAEYAILNYKSDALNKSRTRGASSFVQEAAKSVVEFNSEALMSLKADFDKKAAGLKALMEKYYQIVIELGQLYRQGQGLREEITMAGQDAGMGAVWSPGPGDDVVLRAFKGPIFPDQQTIREVFTTAKVPSPETLGIQDPPYNKRVPAKDPELEVET